MQLRTHSCEIALHLITDLAVIGCVSSNLQGYSLDFVIKYFILCAVACTAVFQIRGIFQSTYAVREAASQGLSFGLMSTQWLLTALTSSWADAAKYKHRLFLASASLTGAAAQLCFIVTYEHLRAPKQPAPNSGHQRESRPSRMHLRKPDLLLVAPFPAMLLVDLLTSTCLEFLGILAIAVLCCAALHAIMAGLPGAFTLGEGMVVSQGLAHTVVWLVRATYQCDLLGAQAGSLSCPLATPFQLFVAGVVVVSLALAAALAALLLPPSNTLAHGGVSEAKSMQPGGVIGNGGGRETKAPGRKPQQRMCSARRGAAGAGVLLAGAVLLWRPALWSIAYALSTRRRARVLTYWVAVMAAALPAMRCLAASRRVSNIIVRKGYHVLAVALFLPAALLEPQLLGIALAIAFALLAAVELLRVLDAPLIGTKVDGFMRSFIDSRDGGAVLITHFTLLLGMAVPLWLSHALQQPTGAAGDAHSGVVAATASDTAGTQRPQQLDQMQGSWGGAVWWSGSAAGGPSVWPAGVAGIMILGFGDTAASVVGRRFGRHAVVCGGRKTWEGAAGGVAFTLLGWWLVPVCCRHIAGSSPVLVQALQSLHWPTLLATTVLSCFFEAITTQLDNLFVPLHYFTLLCCGIRLGGV